jgi:hypothetical protein
MSRVSVNQVRDEALQDQLSSGIVFDNGAEYVKHLISKIRDADDLWSRRDALNEMDLFLEDNVEWENSFSSVTSMASFGEEYDSDGVISTDSTYFLDYDEYESPGRRYSLKEYWDPDEEE